MGQSTIADEGDRLLELGKLQRQQGQPQKAITSWYRAIEYYKQVNDQAAIGHTLSLIGDTYVAMNRMESARMAYQTRLQYATTLDVGIGKIASHNNLATLSLYLVMALVLPKNMLTKRFICPVPMAMTIIRVERSP
jgi:tetratricopeptide (TPR) repeat protein